MSEEDIAWYCDEHGIMQFVDWPDGLVLTDYPCPFPWADHKKFQRKRRSELPYLQLKKRAALPADTPVHIWSDALDRELTADEIAQRGIEA